MITYERLKPEWDAMLASSNITLTDDQKAVAEMLISQVAGSPKLHFIFRARRSGTTYVLKLVESFLKDSA